MCFLHAARRHGRWPVSGGFLACGTRPGGQAPLCPAIDHECTCTCAYTTCTIATARRPAPPRLHARRTRAARHQTHPARIWPPQLSNGNPPHTPRPGRPQAPPPGRGAGAARPGYTCTAGYISKRGRRPPYSTAAATKRSTHTCHAGKSQKPSRPPTHAPA